MTTSVNEVWGKYNIACVYITTFHRPFQGEYCVFGASVVHPKQGDIEVEYVYVCIRGKNETRYNDTDEENDMEKGGIKRQSE